MFKILNFHGRSLSKIVIDDENIVEHAVKNLTNIDFLTDSYMVIPVIPFVLLERCSMNRMK
jgi:hypothetical protein